MVTNSDVPRLSSNNIKFLDGSAVYIFRYTCPKLPAAPVSQLISNSKSIWTEKRTGLYDPKMERSFRSTTKHLCKHMLQRAAKLSVCYHIHPEISRWDLFPWLQKCYLRAEYSGGCTDFGVSSKHKAASRSHLLWGKVTSPRHYAVAWADISNTYRSTALETAH